MFDRGSFVDKAIYKDKKLFLRLGDGTEVRIDDKFLCINSELHNTLSGFQADESVPWEVALSEAIASAWAHKAASVQPPYE